MRSDSHYKHLTAEQVFRKAADYCAYQERCSNEVYTKCISWGLSVSDAASLIKKLISEGFIDEQRFAIAYARGKFKNNKWGKIKIVAELKSKQIPEPIIAKAISLIEEQDYAQIILELIKKKIPSLGNNKHENKQKVFRYLASKGFEHGAIARIISQLEQDYSDIL